MQQCFTFFIEKTKTMKKINQEISKGGKNNEKETNLEINHNDDKLSKNYFKEKKNCKKMLDENRMQERNDGK